MKCAIIYIMVCFSLFFAACSGNKGGGDEKKYSEARTRMEAEAAVRLATARKQLAEGKMAQAKQTVEKMRTDCYLAIDARKQGILLMDSIDLRLALAEVAHIDSLMRMGADGVGQDEFDEAWRKAQFYERKIQYDKKN